MKGGPPRSRCNIEKALENMSANGRVAWNTLHVKESPKDSAVSKQRHAYSSSTPPSRSSKPYARPAESQRRPGASITTTTTTTTSSASATPESSLFDKVKDALVKNIPWQWVGWNSPAVESVHATAPAANGSHPSDPMVVDDDNDEAQEEEEEELQEEVEAVVGQQKRKQHAPAATPIDASISFAVLNESSLRTELRDSSGRRNDANGMFSGPSFSRTPGSPFAFSPRQQVKHFFFLFS